MSFRCISNFYRYVIFVFFTCASVVCSADQPLFHDKEGISLLECVEKALQSNPRLLSKTDERRAAKSRYKQAKTANKPRIKVEETFTRMKDPLGIALPGASIMELGDDKIQIKT